MSSTQQHPTGPEVGAPVPAHRGRRARLRVAGRVVALLVGDAVVSYGQALTFPGNASWQVRTVEWVRDHGGGGLVDVVENWWFGDNAPTGVAPDPASLPYPYPAQVAGVAWLDRSVTATHLIGGPREPGVMSPERAQVPAATRYLSPDQRDFFAVTVAAAATGPTP